MTGFARIEGGTGALAWTWEAKSVNGKSLDLRCRLPFGFEGLEPPLRQAAQKILTRGNVQVSLTLDRGAERARVSVNQPLLEELLQLCRRLEGEGLAPARADGLLALKGVLETTEDQPLPDEQRAERERLLLADGERLFVTLAEGRRREGEALRATLLGHLEGLERLVAGASACAAAQPDALRARLTQLVQELLQASPALPEERLAQEASLLVLKADIREEIDRLTAHIAQARALVQEGGSVGRRLDFLCQELNREANTLCSKSPDLELTRIGLEMKGIVDQIREQVQNVE